MVIISLKVQYFLLLIFYTRACVVHSHGLLIVPPSAPLLFGNHKFVFYYILWICFHFAYRSKTMMISEMIWDFVTWQKMNRALH